MELTRKELAVIRAFGISEYSNGLGRDVIWTFSIEEHSKLSGKVFSGTVSSLTKKGLIGSDSEGDRGMDGPIEDTYTMWLTEQGQMVYDEMMAE